MEKSLSLLKIINVYMIFSPYHKHWVMPTKTNPSYFLSTLPCFPHHKRSINTLKPAPLKKHSKFNFHSNMVDSNLSLAINVCSDVDAYPV